MDANQAEFVDNGVNLIVRLGLVKCSVVQHKYNCAEEARRGKAVGERGLYPKGPRLRQVL